MMVMLAVNEFRQSILFKTKNKGEKEGYDGGPDEVHGQISRYRPPHTSDVLLVGEDPEELGCYQQQVCQDQYVAAQHGCAVGREAPFGNAEQDR